MGKIIYEKKAIQTEEKTVNLDLSILRKKSSAKTPSGLLLVHAQNHLRKKNFEFAYYLQEIYKQVKAMETSNRLRNQKAVVEIEILEGWKGIDNLEMFLGFDADFIIKSHQKNKETGEVTTQTHQITRLAVNTVLSLIKQEEIGKMVGYRDFVPKIMKKYDLKISLNSFNGGKNRTRYYFPKYYYPIKILEALNLIKYSGRGDITRIK